MTNYLLIFPKNKDAEKMLIKLINDRKLDTAKKKLSRYKLDFDFKMLENPCRLMLEAESMALLLVTEQLIKKSIPSNVLDFKEFKDKDEALSYG
jgi:hypothetical protein